jgi:hypothetical protein
MTLQSQGRKVVLNVIGLLIAGLWTAVAPTSAKAQDAFPFDAEIRLDADPMRGSKRVPNIEIGPGGEAIIELWCKGAKGQFSVAGNTVVFVPGAVDDRNCPPDRAAADDALLAALGDATTWRRQGQYISFIGSRTLRFQLNMN